MACVWSLGERFCQEISNLPEPVSVLINNAGYSIRGALEDVSMEAARRIFEVNFFSLIRVTQACLPGMRRFRKGTEKTGLAGLKV